MSRREIYAFIDESGDLGIERGTKHLVICALWTQDNRTFDKLMKKVRRQKRFSRFLKSTGELHANSSSDAFREYVMSELGGCDDVHGYVVVLDKAKIYSAFLIENKHKLYNYVCGDLASKWTLSNAHVVVRIDKTKGKQVLQQDFNKYFQSSMQRAGTITTSEIHHSHSHSWAGLQFTDFVAWSAFRKFEKSDDRFFKHVEHNIGIGHVWKKE